jgi:ribose 5-phosphate isomerase A
MNPARRRQVDSEKRLVAQAAVRWVQNGMRLGLGSGSTSRYFIEFLGEKVARGNLHVSAVASSKESAALARTVGIPVSEPDRGARLDLAVDGADEIGPGLTLIKGGGGALLREKVVVHASRYFLVLGDSSKAVRYLGRFPLPVEVVPFSLEWVLEDIAALGGTPVLRMAKSKQPFRTDQGNYIVDCQFGRINKPAFLASKLEKIPGIVEHGLFLNYAIAALIVRRSHLVVLLRNGRCVPADDFRLLPRTSSS